MGGVRASSEGLVVVAAVGPVAKDLADVAVGPLLGLAAVVGRVWGGVGGLRLRGAVLGVVEVEAVADVAEEPRGGLPLGRLLLMAGGEKTNSVFSAGPKSPPAKSLSALKKRLKTFPSHSVAWLILAHDAEASQLALC